MFKTLLISTAILGGAFSMGAHAACEAGSKTAFSCMTAKGKAIELCDAGKTMDYSFGAPGKKPEIVVRVPRDTASSTQWEGIGRWESYSVEIPNGNTVYSVFWGLDKLSDTHAVEAGVNVETDGQLVATVNCAAKGKIVQRMQGIQLKPTAQ